jgi:hypothetical protein
LDQLNEAFRRNVLTRRQSSAMSTVSPQPWIKASKSNTNGSCVEMRRSDESVEVRDSKLGHASPVHRFSSGGFAAWIEAAKRGEFDQLA